MTQVTQPIPYSPAKAPGPDDDSPHTFFDADSFPAHQFDDVAQQRETATLGMWCFLATEVLLFSGAFLAFFVYRSAYAAEFEFGAEAVDRLRVPQHGRPVGEQPDGRPGGSRRPDGRLSSRGRHARSLGAARSRVPRR